MAKTIIVRYGELALKSERVRRRFERCLIKNIELTLKGVKYKLMRERGRIFIDTSSAGAVVKRLTHVPGIVSVSPADRVDATIEAITSAVVPVVKGILSPEQSFAVRARRVGEHAFSSQDIGVAVGSAIQKVVPGARVDLSAPDLEVSIEVRGKNAYIFTETAAGVGGLPISTQGNVVALLSGGIDSSVAAFLMMKRGCGVFPLFFDNRPYGDGKDRGRAIAMAKKLVEFNPKLELRVAPFGQILKAFIEKAPRRLTCVLCKRSMLRIAEKVAKKVKAESLVTGESLSRIAGQALTNLRVIDEACGLPVMRPLVGMNKADIERTARQIGTFEISARPSTLCPASPKYLETRAKLEDVRRVEEDLDIPTLVKSAVGGLKVIRLR